MSKNLNYVFIGFMKDTSHDKIWGIIELVPPGPRYYDKGSYISFWGRRGSKYQTKVLTGTYRDMYDAFNKKLDKGYLEANRSHLDQIYPNFEKDLETTAFWTVLTKAGDLGEKAFDYVKDKTDIMNE